MSLDIQFQGRDGFKSTMVPCWIWFHKLLIDLFPPDWSNQKKQWNEFLRIHFLDGTVSPCLCICAVFTACLPVATSSCLYSFDFVFGHVSQQITSWALLVNHSSMLRHEEKSVSVCYLFCFTCLHNASCMLTCTQNSFYLMRTPHGSRLAADRGKKKAVAFSWPQVFT